MAQTRAVGRALRCPLAAITVLAGYEPAGAEEIVEAAPDAPPTPAAPPAPAHEPEAPSEPRPEAVTEAQWATIRDLLRDLEELDPATDWKAAAQAITGCPAGQLTTANATILIDKLTLEMREAAGMGSEGPDAA